MMFKNEEEFINYVMAPERIKLANTYIIRKNDSKSGKKVECWDIDPDALGKYDRRSTEFKTAYGMLVLAYVLYNDPDAKHEPLPTMMSPDRAYRAVRLSAKYRPSVIETLGFYVHTTSTDKYGVTEQTYFNPVDFDGTWAIKCEIDDASVDAYIEALCEAWSSGWEHVDIVSNANDRGTSSVAIWIKDETSVQEVINAVRKTGLGEI